MSCERWLGGGIFVTAMLAAGGRIGPGPAGPGRRRALQAHLRPVPRRPAWAARPTASSSASMSPDRVLAAMETGSMVTMANNRIGGRAARHRRVPDRPDVRQRAQHRPGAARHVRRPTAAVRPGPGPGVERLGQRHRRTTGSRRPARPGLTAADVPQLKLKWAFAFPGDLQSYSQATVAGGRLFVGSWGGKVYSLNAATGCIHWYLRRRQRRALGGEHRAGADGRRAARAGVLRRRRGITSTRWTPPPARRSGR